MGKTFWAAAIGLLLLMNATVWNLVLYEWSLYTMWVFYLIIVLYQAAILLLIYSIIPDRSTGSPN